MFGAYCTDLPGSCPWDPEYLACWTHVEFVLDAFNGKVDTALAGVRHDNYGTLKEKINDAFMIVNNNGRAFRDARIEASYLDTRQDELRWAVVAQELKAKDREEQRLIKERIREEERAQRDYDRAMKEAEKEEETIRKAMEKARREFEKAGGDQKAKLEEQLRELTARLQVAEEKNQRALSMAQQTKTGNVYVISNIGSFGEHVYKIGMTRRLEPHDRVRELGDASVPFSFDVHAMIPSQDAPALEHALHKRFVRCQTGNSAKVGVVRAFQSIWRKSSPNRGGSDDLRRPWPNSLSDEQGEPAQRVLPPLLAGGPRGDRADGVPRSMDHHGRVP